MSLDLSAEHIDPRAASLADEVYGVLSRAILDGTLAPGQRLRDVDLATGWGISRTPVREAIQRLTQHGLLEVVPHKYTRVTQPDETMFQESIELMILLTGASLFVGLERMTEEEHAQALILMDNVIEASRSLDDAAVIERATDFYTHVAMSTRNRVLMTVMSDVRQPAQRFEGTWQPYGGDPTRRDAGYGALRDAVERRDGREAERLLRHQLDVG